MGVGAWSGSGNFAGTAVLLGGMANSTRAISTGGGRIPPPKPPKKVPRWVWIVMWLLIILTWVVIIYWCLQ